MKWPAEQTVRDTMNIEVRQGCGTSPLFFGLYLDNVASQWKQHLEILKKRQIILKLRILILLVADARLLSHITK
jgi:hypothetical protein